VVVGKVEGVDLVGVDDLNQTLQPLLPPCARPQSHCTQSHNGRSELLVHMLCNLKY
jgi:hypothetical protein